MNIDEEKQDIPTNYTQVRKGGKSVDSDHVPLHINLNFKIIPTRPTRIIFYNFKNEQGRDTFRNLTSCTNSFSKCFESMQSLQVQCETWKHTLMSYCKKAFPKIRVRRKTKPSAADTLVKERNLLKKKQDDKKSNNIEDLKLIELEEKIADILAEEEMSKINQLKKFSAIYGSICVSEMWKTKKSLWPKKSQSIPAGKIDHKGKLLTGPEDKKKAS